MACLCAKYEYTDAVRSRLRTLSKRRQPRASWMFQWRVLLPQRVWVTFAQRPQKCNVVEVCGEGAALGGAMTAGVRDAGVFHACWCSEFSEINDRLVQTDVINL